MTKVESDRVGISLAWVSFYWLRMRWCPFVGARARSSILYPTVPSRRRMATICRASNSAWEQPYRHLNLQPCLKPHTSMTISPVLKSSMLEFWKSRTFFVLHFVPWSIVRKGVLPKNCSFLWDWTPSHAQRIYKGQNSENPLRAITFDWSDLRTLFQRLWATFLMLFSGIPHLATFIARSQIAK